MYETIHLHVGTFSWGIYNECQSDSLMLCKSSLYQPVFSAGGAKDVQAPSHPKG